MISDQDAVAEQIVRASKLPVSIVFVGVGKVVAGKFKKLEFLDGEDGEPFKDAKGNVAERDIVQFVPFRTFNSDHQTFARELLGELAPQIREFMDEKGIKPDQELIR